MADTRDELLLLGVLAALLSEDIEADPAIREVVYEYFRRHRAEGAEWSPEISYLAQRAIFRPHSSRRLQDAREIANSVNTDGRSAVMARTLTRDELKRIEANQSILRKPDLVLEWLQSPRAEGTIA